MDINVDRSRFHLVDKSKSIASKARIMISGNNHDTRYMLRVLLEMWGYDAIEANGGDETLQLAETEHPQLILVDTSRTYDADLQVVRRIRQSDIPAAVPVIVLSGYSQSSYQKAAFEHGATGLLVKPLDLDLLENYLETCLPVEKLY